jgi:hypothetical protein
MRATRPFAPIPSSSRKRFGALSITRLAQCAALALPAMSCGGSAECLNAPCPLQIAVTITVTSSISGASVTGSFVQNGPSGPYSCNGSPGTTCAVFGSAGTYQLDIGAPGFQTVHRSVDVPGTTPACGCSTVEAQHLDIALVPTP